MDQDFKTEKERIINVALNCNLDGFIAPVVIYNSCAGYLELSCSPIPFSFFKKLLEVVHITSISYCNRYCRVSFILK